MVLTNRGGYFLTALQKKGGCSGKLTLVASSERGC